MSNSSLISYTKISPNRGNYDNAGVWHDGRNHTIDKITIHHVAGVVSVETLGNIFAPASRGASANYGIGNDGRIALYVDEKNRAWTSSSSANDNRAVTIEVSNSSTGGKWLVSDKAMTSLIKLCADICKRNNIKKLNWTGDANGNLTVHRFFAATACPGEYLFSKMPYIADEVNKLLAVKPAPAKPATKKPALKSNVEIAKEVIAGKWGNGTERKTKLTAAGYVYNDIQWVVEQMLAGKQFDEKGNIITAAKPATATLKVGDKVKLSASATYYDGSAIPPWVKSSTLYLRSLNGDRAVISTVASGEVTGAVNKMYLAKM